MQNASAAARKNTQLVGKQWTTQYKGTTDGVSLLLMIILAASRGNPDGRERRRRRRHISVNANVSRSQPHLAIARPLNFDTHERALTARSQPKLPNAKMCSI